MAQAFMGEDLHSRKDPTSITMVTSSSERIVLLFLHGGGFNKETWAPIIRRVQASPLLQAVPCEIEAMDWPYHGSRSDDSVDPVLWFDGPKKNWPRVDHPAKNWPQWAPQELFQRVQKIRSHPDGSHRRARIVVVAHSIGATAAMLLEMKYQGILDGLIAFEPICNGSMAPEVCLVAANIMVANTLARQSEWDTWEDVQTYFRTDKMYRKWHPEATAAYVDGAVKRPGDASSKFLLALPPMQEAALYGYDISAVTFTMEQYRRMKCPVVIEHGDKTTLFRHEVLVDVADTLPTQFSVSPVIKGVAHLMILEDPAACAHRVIKDLQTLPVFQHALIELHHALIKEVPSKL